MLVAYVSGHGFGHMTRTGEVLRAVRGREPRLPLTVVTSAPETLARAAVPGDVGYRRLECDVGLAQKDALRIDEEGTAERCRGFARGWSRLVGAEAEWLRRAGARLVLGDIPPLAFAAAAAAGVPSVGLANFSWDWIYRYLSARHASLADAADRAASAYAQCDLLLELPFAGDLSAFPRREPIPLVARRPRVGREETRRRLGLAGKRVVLVSFGGLGLPGFSPRVLAPLDDFVFVFSEGDGGAPNTVVVDRSRLAGAGLDYADLVGASDVVVTKPGYGIVSDALGAGTRIVYTERGDFPEYPILVRELPQLLPCAHVSNADLLAGLLAEPLHDVLARPLPPPPDLSGAEVAAARILERVR